MWGPHGGTVSTLTKPWVSCLYLTVKTGQLNLMHLGKLATQKTQDRNEMWIPSYHRLILQSAVQFPSWKVLSKQLNGASSPLNSVLCTPGHSFVSIRNDLDEMFNRHSVMRTKIQNMYILYVIPGLSPSCFLPLPHPHCTFTSETICDWCRNLKFLLFSEETDSIFHSSPLLQAPYLLLPFCQRLSFGSSHEDILCSFLKA